MLDLLQLLQKNSVDGAVKLRRHRDIGAPRTGPGSERSAAITRACKEPLPLPLFGILVAEVSNISVRKAAVIYYSRTSTTSMELLSTAWTKTSKRHAGRVSRRNNSVHSSSTQGHLKHHAKNAGSLSNCHATDAAVKQNLWALTENPT